MPTLLELIPELNNKNFGIGRRNRGEITLIGGDKEDILRRRGSIKIPDDKVIYVVSPGWFGRDHYHKIPDDAFVIAVNYAITIPDLKPAIWLCADRNLATAPECHWFIEHLEEIIEAGYPIGVKDIKAGGPVVPVFDSGFLGGIFRRVRAVFRHGKSMVKKQPQPISGRLRAGVTISCQAVQLAYWLGAKKIMICGIDMYSDGYWDGRSTNVTTRHDRIWSQASHFNRLINWLKLKDVHVESLSRTALDVPQPDTGEEINPQRMLSKSQRTQQGRREARRKSRLAKRRARGR